jgi:hypothetical protein
MPHPRVLIRSFMQVVPKTGGDEGEEAPLEDDGSIRHWVRHRELISVAVQLVPAERSGHFLRRPDDVDVGRRARTGA